jgi:hypothetical protein
MSFRLALAFDFLALNHLFLDLKDRLLVPHPNPPPSFDRGSSSAGPAEFTPLIWKCPALRPLSSPLNPAYGDLNLPNIDQKPRLPRFESMGLRQLSHIPRFPPLSTEPPSLRPGSPAASPINTSK